MQVATVLVHGAATYRALAVDLGSFYQAMDLCAGVGSLGGIAEQPGFAPDHKRLNRSYGGIIVDLKKTNLYVTLQPAPVARRQLTALPSTLRSVSWYWLFPASFQLSQEWQAYLLSAGKMLFCAAVFQFALDTVQHIDDRQRDIGMPFLALGLNFMRFNRLAPRILNAWRAPGRWDSFRDRRLLI